MSLPSRSSKPNVLAEIQASDNGNRPTDHKPSAGSHENAQPARVVYSNATWDDRHDPSAYFKPVATGHTTPFYRTRESACNYGTAGNDYMGPDLFSKLSDEVFLIVLANLPYKSLCRASQVSRRWSRLCKSNELWTKLDMSNRRVTVPVILEYLSRGIGVFRLAKAEIVDEPHVAVAMPRAVKNLELGPTDPYKVTHFDLSMMVNVSPSVLDSLLKNCPNLVALSLEHLNLNIDCAAHFQYFTSLELLNLSMCGGICPQVITLVLMRCLKVKELNLAWCNMDRATVLVTVSILPASLERLNISGCRNGTLTDADVLTICRRCPHLKELDLSDTSELTAESMTHIIRHLKRLKVLSMSRCYNINPLAYTWIEELKELNIHGTLTDESVVALKNRLPEGVELNVSNFSLIARPTTGHRRTSIWGESTQDD